MTRIKHVYFMINKLRNITDMENTKTVVLKKPKQVDIYLVTYVQKVNGVGYVKATSKKLATKNAKINSVNIAPLVTEHITGKWNVKSVEKIVK
jgi:hypothetical protein